MCIEMSKYQFFSKISKTGFKSALKLHQTDGNDKQNSVDVKFLKVR